MLLVHFVCSSLETLCVSLLIHFRLSQYKHFTVIVVLKVYTHVHGLTSFSPSLPQLIAQFVESVASLFSMSLLVILTHTSVNHSK